MAGDKRLETMEEELKLLKGELKQSLASVRDYLLNMELPSSEFSTILEALGNGEGQNMTMSGTLSAPAETKPPEETQQEIIETESDEIPPDDNLIDVEESPDEDSHTPAEDSLVSEEESSQKEPAFTEDEADEDIQPDEDVQPGEDINPEIPDESDDVLESELGLGPDDSRSMEYDGIPADASLVTPKVNMLANLISWVAKAKKEIGYDQLATFLEVYGISGHLSSELKEVILDLAEITAEKPEVVSNPEVWSQAMLSLHGILTGGDAPLHPVVPFSVETSEEELLDEDESTEEEEPKEQPLKLKLVFPNGDGKSKEFCINLTPEEDENEETTHKSK
jgi:hypothetical protein